MKKLLCIILLFLFLTATVGQAQFNDSEPMFGQMLNLGHWSTDGLVFMWRGIEAGNFVDESLSRNHGTISGVTTWSGGYLTGSATGKITLENSISLPVGTIIFSGKDASEAVCGTEAVGNGQDYLWAREGVYLRFVSTDTTGSNFTSITSFVGIHTHAVTFDGTNAKAYRDGVWKETVACGNGINIAEVFAGYGVGARGPSRSRHLGNR